jgi:nicotinate phosphoribosyltransferase
LKELYAFVSFGCAFPKTFSSLVDSYNSKESGIKNFLLVGLALSDLGYTPLSIRLDSGDLADLSKYAKKLFKETGEKFGKDFSNIKVVASNDLNEIAIRDLIA